jgi:hypothetical protein
MESIPTHVLDSILDLGISDRLNLVEVGGIPCPCPVLSLCCSVEDDDHSE